MSRHPLSLGSIAVSTATMSRLSMKRAILTLVTRLTAFCERLENWRYARHVVDSGFFTRRDLHTGRHFSSPATRVPVCLSADSFTVARPDACNYTNRTPVAVYLSTSYHDNSKVGDITKRDQRYTATAEPHRSAARSVPNLFFPASLPKFSDAIRST